MNRTWKRGFEAAEIACISSDAPTHAYKVGAALFSGPRLLSTGSNKYLKTHPQYMVRKRTEVHYPVTVHAELSAIIKRKHYDGDKNLVMYVYRGLKDGTAGCSKPCELCEEALRMAGIQRVRFYNAVGEPEEMKL